MSVTIGISIAKDSCQNVRSDSSFTFHRSNIVPRFSSLFVLAMVMSDSYRGPVSLRRTVIGAQLVYVGQL